MITAVAVGVSVVATPIVFITRKERGMDPLRRLGQALTELATATRLAPDVARDGILQALALDASGRREQADAALTEVVNRHPFDRDALSLLVRYRIDRHDSVGAMIYARRLAAIDPSNAESQMLVHRLESGSGR
jgi:Flp pilus assembly protein TadD